MNRMTTLLFAFLLCSSISPAAESRSKTPAAELIFHEVRYDGRLSDDEARFQVELAGASAGKGETSALLFEGDVALLPGRLPDALRIVRAGNQYQLIATRPGAFRLKLELIARIQRAEPWNQLGFRGPAATISSVGARAHGDGMEVQLLSGTLLEAERTNGVSRVKGFLAADQTVSLRWQGKVAEVARRSLLAVDSQVSVHVAPGVVKYSNHFRYDIIQGAASQITIGLPSAQAVTRLVGEQIRDWRLTANPTNDAEQVLTIEFIKPVEKAYELTLFSEQVVEPAAGQAAVVPPQPLDVERESGALSLLAEDTTAEIASLAGLRQVNAEGNAFAAYRFNARPFQLTLQLRRIEPVIQVMDRITARLEETRHLVTHTLNLNVEKAGLYHLEASVPDGFVVAEVRGDAIDEWNQAGRVLRVSFNSRLVGGRQLEVQLERALKEFPEEIVVLPLSISGAAREKAQIGAGSTPGIRLRTRDIAGLREVPITQIARRADELLAYDSDQADWRLTLGCERLTARVVAEVFNLVTIGDGIAGGSATIRYGLANQGVQEFRVKVPAHCRNVEFTGPNIRRKERVGDEWIIGLQDKAWGGYTLVVTYDFQFDAGSATLSLGGIHTAGIERETGSIAITTAASLQLAAARVSDTLRRADETELAAADRALITRAVVLAYQYTDSSYELSVDVKRYAEERVLAAVADRTQLTSVLTEAGEMLTQASFMVKNNEKQFQRFLLPSTAKLWGCYVNGEPARPERDGDWVLISLPREANRDRAFAVDILYAQTNRAFAQGWSRTLDLAAPRTDVPNTYAEWQLFVPATLRLSRFDGSMAVAQGTTYELLDA
jgi:hypothetical protein